VPWRLSFDRTRSGTNGPWGAVGGALSALEREDIVQRIWQRDHTVWSETPDEITNRLGWLDLPESMMDQVGCVSTLRDELRELGWDRAVLLGMGGSSLAPELFAKTFPGDGRVALSVLDSTDPAAVLALERDIDFAKTLFIVATKSGTTAETVSLFRFFYGRAKDEVGGEAGSHFVAVTDPGSALADTAEELGFRATYLNDPNLGGRFSALSFFGLVPAGLIGVDIVGLLSRAVEASDACGPEVPLDENPAAGLGAFLAGAVERGRSAVLLSTSPTIASFADWAEQLIAESTGKDGTGILPVPADGLTDAVLRDPCASLVTMRLEDDEAPGHAAAAPGNIPSARMTLSDPYDLGGQFFIWEMATAIAGHILGIHPFNQPNVESAKVRAREMVAAYRKEGTLPRTAPVFTDDGIAVFGDAGGETVGEVFESIRERFPAARRPAEGAPCPYIAVQAYLPPGGKHDEALRRMRRTLIETVGCPVTVGYGPRFLHSTGQLHKGDAGNGLFLQITADHPSDAPVPDEADSEESSLTFGTLIDAQAMGDMQALQEAGRRVLRFHLGDDVVGGLRRLAKATAA
jgi:glucose-6-phosphate isomerase